MRIITWNCNMAFRKKADSILELSPDILIIQECENLEKLKFDTKPTSSFWYGENPNKGVGVFSFSEYQFEVLDNHNLNFKNVIPLRVFRENEEFILFAIWANNPKDKDGQYVTQVWKAIHFYEELINEQSTLLIGDFNSNTIWDKPKRIGNHSDVVSKLKLKGIKSVYHVFNKQEHGKEINSTLFMYRHENKPYHIDYCFASSDFIRKLKTVEIGLHSKWCSLSDHVPVIIDFDL
ncbi:MAG: endonuclease/exonuclease/phosphatase family protein [Bacteroidetes bacterium]|nr:endonuclease/exonuclease/phosphatase family protein [Bacteroidota bacterium]MBU1373903.1 endonuclease/exonuclease/phosphatase family protein [Bacteroidota bacterium]MBU1485508.1 endonuclease/exonuclease/phosphatase family protein [Bacteroidota bacterium]MBU1760732.1 endonuclease/exonuclease/phosphatase family protein [Bacteroidota bacterium]MBU2268420.1 endonuclease/exonuclease/phosphatase family protein [Bacteroidota bacterium]